MVNRLDIINKLAGRIRKIAGQIEQMQTKTLLQIINESADNILDLTGDIENLISPTVKTSAINHSEALSQTYMASKELLPAIERFYNTVDTTLNEKEFLSEAKKRTLEIRDTILRLLRKLDTYHKLHLNPKFHSHGLTAKDINDMNNKLKQSKRKIDSLVERF